MKKLLTMALALMMVLSLFAVPTMATAAPVYQELIYDGGFEATYSKIGGTNTEYGFIVDAAAVAYSTTEPVKSGNYSMTIETTDPATDFISEFRSNLFAITTGVELKLSADVYLTTAAADATDGTGSIQFVVRDTTSNNVGWGPGRATAEGFEKEYAAPTGSGFMFVGLPLNTWVHVECTSTPTVSKPSSYLYVRPQSSKAYMDNLSVKKAVTGYAINVTELNDFGSVQASEGVAADGTTDVIITPNKGYYLHELKLNGTDVTSAAVKKYATPNYAIPYWCYTVDGRALSADAELTVTYGYYAYGDELAPGGDAEGLTAWNETGLGKAGNSTVALETTTVKSGAQSFKVTSAAGKNTYTLRTPTIDFAAGGTYVAEFDAYTDSTAFTDYKLDGFARINSVYEVGLNGYLQAGINMKQHSYIPLKSSAWQHFTVYIDNNYTETVSKYLGISMICANDTDAVYFDNVSVKKLTEAGAAPLAPVTPPAPTTAAVTGTTNNADYGTVTPATETVDLGEDVTFTVTPKLGYYVAAATLNGESVLASFDAYKGGTYTVEAIAADATLAVEFAAVTAKGENVATVSDSFVAADTAVTFGKVLDRTNATSWGVELTKGGVGVTPYHGGSYLYKALAEKTKANGQYAIEFVGLEAGTYQIRSYVYVNGVATFGAPSTFVVE